MVGIQRITLPVSNADLDGAYRVIDEFHRLHAADLSTAHEYLNTLMTTTAASYADGYRPWQKALKEFLQGIYLLVKKVPLPNTRQFKEALLTFSLASAANFVFDLCMAAKRNLSRDWVEMFHHNILAVLASFQIISQSRQVGLSHGM